MDKKIKVLIISINLILILFILSNTVFGAALVDKFKGSIDTTGANDLKDTGGEIVGIIQIVGTITAVGMLTFLGIKYVIGSADQKAEYKKSMLPYFIGAVLIFGFSNITQIIYEWANTI